MLNINLKKALILVAATLFLSYIFHHADAEILLVDGSSFELYLLPGDEVNFRHGYNDFNVTLDVKLGTLNASVSDLKLWYDRGGYIQFTTVGSITFEIEFSTEGIFEYANCTVTEVTENELYRVTASAAAMVFLRWNSYISSFLPLDFILGLIGVVGVPLSIIYGYEKIKKREYREALELTTVFLALSIALVIAWLWG